MDDESERTNLRGGGDLLQFLELPHVDEVYSHSPDYTSEPISLTLGVLMYMLRTLKVPASYPKQNIDILQDAISKIIPTKLSPDNSALFVFRNHEDDFIERILDHIGALSPYFLDEAPNFSDSDLDTVLDELKCTLGALNRILDPIEGPDVSRETAAMCRLSSKLPPTRISEPVVNYYCPPPNRLLHNA